MKGRDVIALFEYGRTFDQKRKPRRRKKKETTMNLDDLPAEVLINKMENHKRKYQVIQSYLEDQAKLNKKEEKKEEKKGWDKLSFIQKITVLTAVVPITMMIYMLVIIAFVKLAVRAMGL